MSGKITEKELWKINKKLAAIIKANYTEDGVGCISCGNSFAVCPHCVRNAIISEHPKNLKGFFGTVRYLRDILPRKLSFYLFSSSLSAFNY